MVEMTNRMTGTTMLVAEDRVSEYLQKGHKIATKMVKAETVTVHEKKPEKAPEEQPKQIDEVKPVETLETPVKAKTGRGRGKKK